MVGLRGVTGTLFSPRQDSGDGKDCGTAWYGGTEGSPWDSLQSPPGLRGWEGLWDCSGMMGLRGVTGTPFSPCQDSWDGKDCRIAVVCWD